jgi:hypothetical protein
MSPLDVGAAPAAVGTMSDVAAAKLWSPVVKVLDWFVSTTVEGRDVPQAKAFVDWV